MSQTILGGINSNFIRFITGLLKSGFPMSFERRFVGFELSSSANPFVLRILKKFSSLYTIHLM